MANFEPVEDDKGPWQVDVWRIRNDVVIQSHDGSHDVALVVNGDFSCIEQKIEYANKMRDRLNAMPGTRPLDWRTKHD